jgi:glycerophosphoryl diester phosphodiesterase
MQVIAHRGASGHRPENTLPAYELAIEMRADMIEIDLHRTRDGAVVITHDAELLGLGPDGGPGEIGDASCEAVRALDVDGERIPTLEEVLDGYATRIPFNLEIKWGADGDYPGLEAQTLDALRERGLGETILFSSFRPSILHRLRELDASARLALLTSPRDPDYVLDVALRRARELGCEALNPHWSQVDAELVARAHEVGLGVNVYTVDDLTHMRQLWDLGVDALFTNFPDRLRGLLDA